MTVIADSQRVLEYVGRSFWPNQGFAKTSSMDWSNGCRRMDNLANVPAMLISTGFCLVLLLLIKNEIIKLGWTRLVVIGTVVTFTPAYLLGPIVSNAKSVSRDP